jgi:hypothetical protein
LGVSERRLFKGILERLLSRRLQLGYQRSCEHHARLEPALISGYWLRDVSRLVAGVEPCWACHRQEFELQTHSSHGQAKDFHAIDCGGAVALLVLWSYSMWGSTYLRRGPDRQTVLCPWRTTSQVREHRWSEDLRLERIRIGSWVKGVVAREGCLVRPD